MDFAQPTFLYCFAPLLFIGLAFYLLIKRRQKLLARLGAPELITRLSETVNWTGRRWRATLWTTLFILLVVALARPRWGNQVEYIERQGVEIMVALDISKSMLAEDLKPNRLARAKLEITELMEELGGNDIGLVLFSGEAFIQFPLTSDLTTARFFLDAAHPGIISRPGTALEDAINTAITGFNEERATQRVIILLTDGENHEGDVLAAANEAKERDIIIYAIGFGSPNGEPIPEYDEEGVLLGYKKDRTGETVLSQLDETTLQDLARISGGRYFRATADGSEVGFLAEEIQQLQTSELENRYETRRVERFQLFILMAIFSIIIIEFIPDRIRRKVTNS